VTSLCEPQSIKTSKSGVRYADFTHSRTRSGRLATTGPELGTPTETYGYTDLNESGR